MMLAGIPVPDNAVDGLAELVRAVGADELADRLEGALGDDVKLLALTIDERAIILAALEDHAKGARSYAASSSTNMSGGSGRGSIRKPPVDDPPGGLRGSTDAASSSRLDWP
jgi:hypothetical protein